MTLNYAFFCVGENLHTELYLHIPKIHNAPIFVGVFVYLFTLFIHTSILPKIHTREALSALLHHLHFSLPSHLPHTILTCNQNGASSLSHVRRVTRGDPYMCVCVCSGLVPEPTFQREAHEAAERAGRPEARVFPEPEADEDAGGPAGARGADPQRALLLLRRYAFNLANF